LNHGDSLNVFAVHATERLDSAENNIRKRNEHPDDGRVQQLLPIHRNPPQAELTNSDSLTDLDYSNGIRKTPAFLLALMGTFFPNGIGSSSR
jgi:hypothetical protein